MSSAKPSSTEQSPLLPVTSQSLPSTNNASTSLQHNLLPGADENDVSLITQTRRRLRTFLSSKAGHYTVIILVSLDITCIFASFLVSLHVCEHHADKGFQARRWKVVGEFLGMMSLIFSSLFVIELAGSLFGFGLRYLTSPFHILDATVIMASFVVDVALRGGLEEAGSLVIVLRFWRVFKIIEEFSTGADEQMDGLREHIERLEREKFDVVKENEVLKGQAHSLNAG